jgi:hypothetical protein
MRAKVAISTVWRGNFHTKDVSDVEHFEVDTSIDGDADTWAIAIGDPDGKLIDVLARDNEVKVNLYAIGTKTIEVLHTGFADEIGFDLDGRLAMNGRDISAVAVDTQAKPNQWVGARPDKIVAQRARALKIGDRLQLDPTHSLAQIWTDGSESEWEFWYRLYRKSSRYLWAEPDGTIIGGFLNYTKPPAYFFGEPQANPNQSWIPVESLMWRSTKSQRIYECYVYGHKGKGTGFVGKWRDNSISHWVKKPVKILQDSGAHTPAEATISAKDEIFDSQVGSVEWTLVVADPGFMIRQNRMAKVNLPSIGLSGIFFVVGNRIVNGTDGGQYQMVRLREKNFALSKKIPSDPGKTGEPPTPEGVDNVKTNLSVRWAEFFIRAALRHHGPWNFKLFLSVLLAMCEVETGFRNVREGGTTEWYLPPSMIEDPQGVRKFRDLFANESPVYGVGAMQLTDLPYKVAADKMLDPALIDELVGGRWYPEWNIMESGAVFRGFLRDFDNSPTQENIWNGVGGYNGGPNWREKPAAVRYMNTVKDLALNTYLPMVEAAFIDVITPVPTGDISMYANPFRSARSLICARIDMGVDYAAIHGSPIYAIGPARVVLVDPSWLGNSNWTAVVYQLTDGLYADKHVFVAEYVTAERGIQAGSIVDASSVVARFSGSGAAGSFSGDGIEMGWSDSSGAPLALPYYPGGGRMTVMGENFNQLMTTLGCPSGRAEHPPPVGTLPPGWPKVGVL